MAKCLTLKKSNCKNCYKCIRHCPVKSIRFSGNQAHIIEDECILCGQCFVVCPQNAKEIVDETEKVKVLLQGGDPVIVSLAPSFVANYNAGIGPMREAIKKLGFFDVEETAIGATMVKTEYERLISEEKRDVIISSCCHSINLLIQKYFPAELGALADVLSPMQAHCQDIKKRHPGAKTVFIGPCVAKKDEAQKYPGIVDAVLTFEELQGMFDAREVDPSAVEPDPEGDFTAGSAAGRGFAVGGGVAAAVAQLIGEKEPGKTIPIEYGDGLRECRKMLMLAKAGKYNGYLLEGMGCPGGCVAGAGTIRPVKTAANRVAAYQAAATRKSPLEDPERDMLEKIQE